MAISSLDLTGRLSSGYGYQTIVYFYTMSTASITCLSPLVATWLPWNNSSFSDQSVAILRLKATHNEPLANRWHALLNSREQQRASRFRKADDRNRFILGRALFRLVSSQLSGLTPQRVTIEHTFEGKPYLADAPQWDLSVAHSGDWVVLAVAPMPVGVDVEFINPRFQIDDLIPTTLTFTEQREVTKSNAPHAFFYELWTRKEALVKATGTGVTEDFGAIPVLEGAHAIDANLIGTSGKWAIQPFFVQNTYPAAVATVYTSDIPSFLFYDVTPNDFN